MINFSESFTDRLIPFLRQSTHCTVLRALHRSVYVIFWLCGQRREFVQSKSAQAISSPFRGTFLFATVEIPLPRYSPCIARTIVLLLGGLGSFHRNNLHRPIGTTHVPYIHRFRWSSAVPKETPYHVEINILPNGFIEKFQCNFAPHTVQLVLTTAPTAYKRHISFAPAFCYASPTKERGNSVSHLPL